MNNECHLFKKNGEIIGWVAVNFFDLSEFVEIIGKDTFSDGGLEVTMMDHYIAVETHNLIDGDGEYLSDYKECFGDEWNEYPELQEVANEQR